MFSMRATFSLGSSYYILSPSQYAANGASCADPHCLVFSILQSTWDLWRIK